MFHDPWIDNPPKPVKKLNDQVHDQLMVSDLMKPFSSLWDEERFGQLIQPDDVSIIKRIHPKLIKTSDVPTWIYTKKMANTLSNPAIANSPNHP